MTNTGGTVFRHYIPAGNNLVVYARTAAGAAATYYITKDSLGSSGVITDQAGMLVVSEKYSALGWNENTVAQEAAITSVTRHEFTGHEGINNAGLWLVNMNGRVYSPSGSMFMSADPFIQDPTNTLSYNRYSYVEYNPLTNIDPSGYFNLGDLLNPFSNDNPLNPFGKFGRKLALLPFTSSLAALKFGQRQGDSLLRDNTWLQPIAEIAACYFGGPWGCAGANAYLTRLNGGSIEDALIAGFVSYVDYGMNAGIDSEVKGWAGRALLKGFVAGTSAEIMGGSFTRGFELAASFSVADSAYQHFTDHPPGWGAGEDRPYTGGMADAPQSNNYIPAGDYSVPPPFWNVNTFGFNAALTGNGSLTDCFTQSGACSSFFDKIPGLQAISQLHDAWTNYFTAQLVKGLNFPTMLPAAVISYGALLDQYGAVPGLQHGHGH
jgi:RHS repeat-associated protein